MDFFVEAGVLFGHCDEKDEHHPYCKNFFWGKYGFNQFAYYISEHSVKDFQTLRFKKIRQNGYPMQVYEIIETCMVRLLDFITRVDYEKHNPNRFRQLAECLKAECDCHPPDNCILSDAIFWSLRADKKKMPVFVTVDGKTIKNKRDVIYQKAETVFTQAIPLQIKGVWEL